MRAIKNVFYFSFWSMLFTLLACTNSSKKTFQSLSASQTGIDFENTIENTEQLNIFNYRNFYNGAGVAIGDINNDGLSDVYFTGNLVKNKLYLNQGDFKFKDIAASSGTEGKQFWSTGVVMVDINHDGFLDIYVCNAGYKKGETPKNELFINNGDLTFTEKAEEYNLADDGYTTHAAFFDYDLDGDLDVYILNNSFIPVNTIENDDRRELYAEDWEVRDFLKGGGDKLMRNDNGKFVDVSKEANIYGSLIGYGLGVTVGDVNNDMYPDIYVSNDFFERDYLYINQKDGTFKDEVQNQMEHLSLSSMGADMADINNDGYPEIFVTEMLPSEEYRLKTMTKFENYNVYSEKLKKNFHYQYMQNTLQLNNQNNSFSEIAHFSGVAASDWSWGALMFDADNDGLRDIYVCNGIYHDLTNQDFINFFANDVKQKMVLSGEKEKLNTIVNAMESNPQRNNFFKNNGDLTFKDVGKTFGFETPSFSNGAAYGDLDNDGDLDLIVNNVNQAPFIYQNKTNDGEEKPNYLTIQLKGEKQNTFAVGSKVTLFANGQQFNTELIPSRGFQSSVDYRMVFGLGSVNKIDSIKVVWYDLKETVLKDVKLNNTLTIDYQKSINRNAILAQTTSKGSLFTETNAISFNKHEENVYSDFYQEGLISKMLSREGPAAAVADVNNDGLEDVFVGGAANQVSQLYIQQSDGSFQLTEQPDFDRRKYFEDTEAVFFDADGDGDNDLFVGSGGNQKAVKDITLQDRIYLNDGQGNMTLTNNLSSNGFNTSVAVPFDFDGDGDLDLFVGSRSLPQVYGVPPKSFVYENDGKGVFVDKTKTIAPKFETLGMVTDAKWINITGDDKKELVIIGEWMSPRIFSTKGGKIEEQESNLNSYKGWWYAIEANDVDNDGDLDLILGNRGENFYYTGTEKEPVKLWIHDFDANGTIDKIVTRTINGKDMPVPLQSELTANIVSLKKQNLKHSEFANKSLQELFPDLKKSFVLRGNYFKSAIAINDGNGNFTMKALPTEVQFSCVCDIACTDVNNDGKTDLVLGGNYDGFTPQFSKLDASFGHVLINSGKGNFNLLPNNESGYFVKGDVKKILPIQVQNKKYLLTILNNKMPKWHEY